MALPRKLARYTITQFLTTLPEEDTFALPEQGWFSGGFGDIHDNHRFITAVSQGREAAISMDRFLQGASLTASRIALRHGQTKLFTSTKNVASLAPIHPQNATYTLKEAQQEAQRCLDCQCLECVKNCKYLESFGSYPKAYVRRIYNNSAIVKGIHQANTMINSCSLCRQCEVLCPHDFSMADLCLDARQTMVQENRMPPSAHWFALEEMRSATDEAAVARHAPDSSTSTFLFFPGCQLAAIRPQQTLRLWDHLLSQEGKTGIWLDCCAAPAHWAGRKDIFDALVDKRQHTWEELDRPQVITACSTCLMMFREHMQSIPVQSVWTMVNVDPQEPALARSPLALSDPCTSRDDEETKTAVRNILKRTNQPLAPFPMSGTQTECCGFGGLMENSNPELARQVANTRVAQTDADILTYCAMCREQLAKTGKPVLHLLDLLFPEIARDAKEKTLSLSDRRIWRRKLKHDILSRYPDDTSQAPEPWEEIPIVLSKQVVTLMEERRILADDIRQVLYQADQGGSFFVHGSEKHAIASARLGLVTFWIQYYKSNERYHITSCWSHRMSIGGEEQ